MTDSPAPALAPVPAPDAPDASEAPSLPRMLPPPPAYLRAHSRTPEPVLALTTTTAAPAPSPSPQPQPQPQPQALQPQQGAVVLRARERPAPPSATCFLCARAHAPCFGGVPCERCRAIGVPHMCITSESIYSSAAARQSRSAVASESASACALSPAPHPAVPAEPAAAAAAAAQVDPVYVMRELAAMKREQRRLLEDMELLRYQNEKLERSLETAKREVSSSQQSLKEMEAQQREMLQQQQVQQVQQQCDAEELPPTPGAARPRRRRVRSAPEVQPQALPAPRDESAPLPTRPHKRRRRPREEGVEGGGVEEEGVASCAPAAQAPAPVQAVEGGPAVLVYDLTAKPPRVCHASPAVGALLGTAPAALLGAPWFRLVHRSLGPQTLAAMDKVARTGAPAQTTELYQHRGGGFIQTTDTHSAVFDAAGLPLYDVVTIVPFRPPAVPAPTAAPSALYPRLYAAAHPYANSAPVAPVAPVTPVTPVTPAWACPVAADPAASAYPVPAVVPQQVQEQVSPAPQQQQQQTPVPTPQVEAESGGVGEDGGAKEGNAAADAGAAPTTAGEQYYDLFATSDPTSGSDDTPPQPFGVTPTYYGYPYS